LVYAEKLLEVCHAARSKFYIGELTGGKKAFNPGL
jgi:hypothetical protein